MTPEPGTVRRSLMPVPTPRDGVDTARVTPPAKLPPPGDERAIYVLDVSGYVFRAYHALPPLSSASGEPTHAVLGFTNMLLKLVADQKPQHLCVCYDPPGPSFRKTRYPEYKSNRKKHPDDLYAQLDRCFDIVRAYEIPGFRHDEVEADDLIATVSRLCRAAGHPVVIVSSDKDLLQLVGDGTVMYDTMRSRVYGEAETREKLGVPPHQVRDLLALTGDSSDNVPGVPSVGPKTAKSLLEAHGSLDGIFSALETITKKALKKKLEEHRDDAFLSKELVTLRDDVDIAFDLKALRWSGGDAEALHRLFTELEFTRLLDQLEPPREAVKPPESDRVCVTDSDQLAEMIRTLRGEGAFALFCALEREDPFEGHLVGLSFSTSSKSYYVPTSHHYLGAPDTLDEAEVLSALRPLLSDPALKKRAPSLKRETIALKRREIDLAGFDFDITIASYLLEAGRHAHRIEDVARAELNTELLGYDRVTEKQRGSQKPLSSIEIPRVMSYACERSEVSEALSGPLADRMEKAANTALLRDVELPLAHVLAQLETTGVRLDLPYLREMSKEVGATLRTLESRCHELAGREFNVASPKQLEAVLFDHLGLRVVKKTRTGGRSTDVEVLEELSEEHQLPMVVLEHRQLSKLKGTYLDALPKQVNARTGRVHTVYHQAVAATGRLSSSDPNLQNIPIRTEVGRRIREAFVAADGWTLLSADYSQIELRVLAHLAEDPELIEAFSHNEDVHVRTATALFDVDREDVTREQRGQAKTVNYAVIYGQSQFALARNLGIERREAQRYIDAFFERYAGVKNFMDRTIQDARRDGSTRTLLGRRRDLPELQSRNRQHQMAAERMARNTPIQGTAADIMKVAMVAIDRAMKHASMAARMLLTVHDELVFEAPRDEKDALEKMVRTHMEQAVPLKVPLVVDAGWGATWGAAH